MKKKLIDAVEGAVFLCQFVLGMFALVLFALFAGRTEREDN